MKRAMRAAKQLSGKHHLAGTQTRMRHSQRKCWIVLLSVMAPMAMTACGFHLRGTQQAQAVAVLPPVYLSGTGELVRVLHQRLRQAGANVHSQPEEARWRVSLSQEDVRRELLSISARTGKSQEYELVLTFNLQVHDAERAIQLNNETMRLARDYIYNTDIVAANLNEELRILADLRREAAERILHRLEGLALKSAAESR